MSSSSSPSTKESVGSKLGAAIAGGRQTHRMLRVGGGIGGAITTFVGVWSFIGITFDIKLVVNAFYLIILGFFMVMAQLRVESMIKKFELIRNYTGLGFYYLFVAGLALGTSWFDYALALFLALIGVVYLYLSLCKGIKNAPVNYELPEAKDVRPDDDAAAVKIEMKQKITPNTPPSDSAAIVR